MKIKKRTWKPPGNSIKQTILGKQPPLRHKYKAVRVENDGINFDSKKEARRYNDLKILQANGEIVFFLHQVPLFISKGVKYWVDFQIFWSNGNVTFEDVKGFQTESFKTKKKLVESKYPIEILVS